MLAVAADGFGLARTPAIVAGVGLAALIAAAARRCCTDLACMVVNVWAIAQALPRYRTVEAAGAPVVAGVGG